MGHIAVLSDNIELMKLFVADLEDKNPPVKSESNRTLLYFSALSGKVSFLEYLSQFVEDLNPGDIKGYTPLHGAAYRGHVDFIRYIVERLDKAEINPPASLFWRNQTPLHRAAEAGHLNVIKYLAPKVQDINVKDSNGQTPRDYALGSRTDIVEFFDQLS